MSYVHPYQDAEFILRHVVGLDDLCEQAGLDEINTDLAMTVLEEAGKLGSDVLAPLNRSGDEAGVTLGEKGVQEAAGFKEAYQQFAEGGWMSLTADEEFGGQNLPNVLSTAVTEIWNSANMSFALCPLLSQGAMESLKHHGSTELQNAYLPKMIEGTWPGTMNLTEPDAGTDLAAVKTKAIPEGDHFLISGQKIFITWGDHQMTDNIVHLVLARLPDAPAGVKGISLFIVPKFTLDDAGEPAARNGAHCISLEHKLGIHASPTCVMEFKDAEGYLVGEANNGLSYMFTMMNHARQAVGLQGLAISERAYQQAVMFAKDRVQGTRRDGSRIPIIQHPDVRRMLMVMKASTEAMRALALTASAEIDRANYAKDAESKAEHEQRVELYTPIIKGWLTELGMEVTSLGVQVHGGMGFIEETGAAQHYRDARILPIYEGTNGIQALDFIGRKMLSNKGEVLQSLITDMEGTLAELRATEGLHSSLDCFFTEALEAGSEARKYILEQAASDRNLPGSVSYNFMMLFGYLAGGWVMVQSAMKAQALLAAGEGDPEFLKAKLMTSQFYCEQLLPRAKACLSAVLAGSSTMMNMPEEQF
uniref:3-methylmercaptopropionyl-CoA dehydrogenase n=1 Tax=uncultured Thiotrichaceae bacterium TaxID=298394 RepID=A0A6S6TLH9_9GAMM|nr:MAG: Acyl-CoA dehydrogenase (EC [uncultured Thiotrichaceae bacterium]